MSLPSSILDNQELISDLARFSEGVLTEEQVRRRWPLATQEAWEQLDDDLFVKRVEEEKIRRIRSGAYKREASQKLIAEKGVSALDKILSEEKGISPRHKIDAVRTLGQLAGFGPEAAAEQDMVSIVINLGDGEIYHYGGSAKPVAGNVNRTIDAAPPERAAPLIEQFDEPPVKRGRGRPRGSKNRPKVKPVEREPRPRGLAAFDV